MINGSEWSAINSQRVPYLTLAIRRRNDICHCVVCTAVSAVNCWSGPVSSMWHEHQEGKGDDEGMSRSTGHSFHLNP